MLNRMLVCVLAVLGLLAAGPAQGQDLPSEIVSKIALAEPDKDAVRQYVRTHADGLVSLKPSERKAAKDALLSPLDTRKNPSVSFRLEYTASLKKPLEAAMMAGPRSGVCALAIAGELASPDALAMIRAAMGSPDHVLRHQACGLSLRSVFVVLKAAAGANAQPALGEADVRAAIKDLAAKAAGERDDLVLDACVNSLAAAAELDAYRTEAFAGLEQVVTAQCQGGAPAAGKVPALLRAADEGVLRQVSRAGARFDAAAAKSAASLAGRLLAATAAAVKAPNLSPAQRELYTKVAATCQNILPFAAQGASVTVPDAAASLAKGTRDEDAKFILMARDICGPTGLLSKPPFNFPAGEFIK